MTRQSVLPESVCVGRPPALFVPRASVPDYGHPTDQRRSRRHRTGQRLRDSRGPPDTDRVSTGGAITFDEGHFQWSPSSAAAYHAKRYHEFQGIEGLLTHHCEVPFERSLEVGCGYGHLSSWLARLSGAHHAVDPNSETIEMARTHYPQVDFREASAQALLRAQ